MCLKLHIVKMFVFCSIVRKMLFVMHNSRIMKNKIKKIFHFLLNFDFALTTENKFLRAKRNVIVPFMLFSIYPFKFYLFL